MKNYLEYKGYTGSVEYSDEDKCLFGKVLGIRSLITYEGQSVEELKKGFEYMLDGYLEDCKAEGKEPEKPYKGSLNVRIGSDTHRILAMEAQAKDVTINFYIKEILDDYIKKALQGNGYCPPPEHRKV
ncbi:antitoxin HicB [Candidatus Gastranaerophilus sp. (ex Termes propinquus)]|nr:antitoxin HicB [Candidatus Gastranaerophilus sp. (ex Termes propinquus)]